MHNDTHRIVLNIICFVGVCIIVISIAQQNPTLKIALDIWSPILYVAAH